MRPSARNTARGTVREGSRTSPLGPSATSTPDEGEHQDQHRLAEGLAPGQAGPGEVRGRHRDGAGDHQQQKRQQLGDRHRLDEVDARVHAPDVDGGQRRRRRATMQRRSRQAGADSRHEHRRRGRQRGERRPSSRARPTASRGRRPRSPRTGRTRGRRSRRCPRCARRGCPASAKQATTSAISRKQTRNASGAAAPIRSATAAGSTKMPAPMVLLTTLAVRPASPMPRTRPSRVAGRGSGIGGVYARTRAGRRKG